MVSRVLAIMHNNAIIQITFLYFIEKWAFPNIQYYYYY